METGHTAAREKAEEIAAGYEGITAEGKQLSDQLKEIEDGKAALKAESKDLEIRNKEYEKEIKKLETKAIREREKREKRREELRSVQLEFSSLSQKDSFILENILRISGEMERLEGEAASLRDGIRQCRQASGKKKTEILSIRQKITETTQEAARLQDLIKEDTASREDCVKKQRGLFEKQEAMSGELARLDKENYRLESQKEKCEELIEQQIRYLW